MSRKTTISRNFGRLAVEKKVILFSAFATFVSCFMPWYGSNSRLLINRIDWNAFDNIGSVGGYLISGFALITLSMVTLPIFVDGLSLTKKLPVRESSLLLFLSGQSAFVSLLFIAIYSQYALLQSANSSTRFGLYITLVSSLITSVATLTMMQKEKRSMASPLVSEAVEDIDDQSFSEEGEYEAQEIVADANLEHRPLQTTQPGWGEQESEILEETSYNAPISREQYHDQMNQDELVESFEKASTWEKPSNTNTSAPSANDRIEF